MQLFINNWSTQLAAGASAVAVQMTIDPAEAAKLTGLGSGDYYLLTLAVLDGGGTETAWEVVKVTGKASGVLDVVRAQEGTTALIWSTGAAISARATRGTLEALRDSGGGPAWPAAQTFTGNKTLGLADAGTYNISQDATAQTVTVPPQASVAWEADTEIHIQQGAAGAVSIAAGAGVTINRRASATAVTDGAYSVVTLKRTASNVWTLFGALVPV